MRKGQFVTTLALHACPKALLGQIETIFEDLDVVIAWHKQELLADHYAIDLTLKITEEQSVVLASRLYALGPIYFELNQRQGRVGVLLMAVPGLGIYRGELNDAGSIMLSEDRINLMVASSAGNQREFMRLLRMSLGQSWDDIIEPFRGAKYSDNVVLLNRAG
jgi:hypothetical protein